MPKAGRLILSILIILVLVSVSITSTAHETPWWDETFSHRQEISIPIDTSLEYSKFQPIDIKIDFDNSCWAKNTEEHSLRVIFERRGEFKEIECQIYDLEYTNKNHIKSCNLVFIIPEEANGEEKYYLYYDGNDKTGPDYFDHVKVEDSYFEYAPIPGYSVEGNYFNIIDGDYSIYQICYDGKLLDRARTQYVTKLKEHSKTIEPKNGELFAVFDFSFFNENSDEPKDYISTMDELVSKEILVDGNLMINVGIVSKSKNNEVQTTAYYKYYHCSSSDKRLHVKVKHESNKDIKTTNLDVLAEGTYAYMQTSESISRTIKELNFGKVFPYLHLYNEKDFISEYKLDTDPDYIPTRDIPPVIGNEDDVDLGKKAWICFDDGEEGVSHSLIFGSNEVVQSGSDERDGIRVAAYSDDYPHLPGLEVNNAGVMLNRNTYESGGQRDLSIPKDFCAEFYVDFFSSQSGGYLSAQNEAEIFQRLVKSKPSKDSFVLTNIEDIGKNELTVYLHNSKSSQYGLGLSALTGLNVSYETVELYQDNKMIRSSSPAKIEMNKLSDDFKKTGLGSIKSTLSSINLESLSLFKKVSFSNLEEGTYLVKIYRKNCLMNEKEKIVGFKLIEVNGDTVSHIYCRPAGVVSLSIFDQKDKPVDNVDCNLFYNNVCISKGLTSDEGKITFSAPVFLNEKYTLNLNYRGFDIISEPIELGLTNILRPKKIDVDINRYDLKIKLFDSLGLPCSVDIDPVLRYDKNTEIFYTSNKNDECYSFNNVFSEEYILQIPYKNDLIEKEINVNSDEEIELIFPFEYAVNSDVFNIRGEKIDDWKILLLRSGKELEFNSSDSYISLPPGNYDVEVYSNNRLLSKSKIEVTGETSLPVVTEEEPLYPILTHIFLIFVLFFGCILLYKNKRYTSILLFSALIIAIISLLMPWWSIYGFSDSKLIETSSKMFLIPTNLVTMTTGSDYSMGDISFLPDTFLIALYVVISFVLLGFIFLSFSNILKKRLKKKLASLFFIFGLLSFILSALIFTFSMSEFANVSTGSFIGIGDLDIRIPLENSYESISCIWGPDIGFYLLIVSIVLLLCFFILKGKKGAYKFEDKFFDSY